MCKKLIEWIIVIRAKTRKIQEHADEDEMRRRKTAAERTEEEKKMKKKKKRAKSYKNWARIFLLLKSWQSLNSYFHMLPCSIRNGIKFSCFYFSTSYTQQNRRAVVLWWTCAIFRLSENVSSTLSRAIPRISYFLSLTSSRRETYFYLAIGNETANKAVVKFCSRRQIPGGFTRIKNFQMECQQATLTSSTRLVISNFSTSSRSLEVFFLPEKPSQPPRGVLMTMKMRNWNRISKKNCETHKLSEKRTRNLLSAVWKSLRIGERWSGFCWKHEETL